ncbi:type II and III secretion system protein [Halothece sp. PCC 7418]|uniref:type IV pilus secretin family protein n=1 Tax=Halothece sp. (strain PCC 7418) TaxID=65093 RepID=UPI0002A08D93|nr:type IV pilus secretin family protein [Halothece sp. PCC 7418]AFZ42380.1 type II and III secretion system protein [Halothece sp. PCC 7418]
MKYYSQQIGILFGATAILVAQPFAREALAQMQQVQSQPTEEGFALTFDTNSSSRPQIFTIQRDNILVVDLTDTQLTLGNGEPMQKSNPFPGVEFLEIAQSQGNNVRVIVRGTNDAPDATIQSFANGEVTLSFAVEGGGGSAVSTRQSPQSEQTFSQASPANPSSSSSQAQPEVMFPDPEITVDGKPTSNRQIQRPSPGLQPTRPRAIAPPVGDIAVSTIDSSPNLVDLGTNTRVPRLVLREAPVREVLSLLARSANVNLVFADQGGEGDNPAQQTISVDLENEPVQAAFNSILQLSGLQANRRGNTIFVGANLPQAVRNVMTRTLRLNQVSVDAASGFLATQGAEVQQVVTPVEQEFNQETGALVRERELPSELRPLTVNQPEGSTGALLLRGMSVSTDERLNAITLVGEPRKIATAVDLLKQLDARRRQVAVNVKIIDINLNNTEDFSSSFSFGINDSFFVNDGGAAAISFGGSAPPSRSTVTQSRVSPPVIPNPFADANTFLDFNETQFIPSTDPGVVEIDTRTGQLTETPRGGIDFFTRNAGVSENPFEAGFTEVTLAENQVITISEDDEGNLQFDVAEGTIGDATAGLPSLFQFPSDFLGVLEAQITSGNAKILTDPTLLVKEGQTAGVNLVQEVFAGSEVQFREVGEESIQVEVPVIKEAGLTLNVDVQRIDDNGFITLNVNPTVSAPSGSADTGFGEITLLNKRELNSGEIRLRDGQTLILAGIIQDEDRTTVSKVPILGDLPIIGSLFRSTNRDNIRREVIVLLTPNILDDSLGSSGYGSNYQLSPSAREMLQQQGYPIPQQGR